MRKYQTKKDFIYETLKADIYNGKYGFNDKLVISRLAKEFETSEIPVREALNQLASDGLIDFKPHVGAVVNSLSKENIKEIFELRIELEGLATRLATPKITSEGIEQLQKIHQQSIEAVDNKNYDLYRKLNFDFHMKIYEYADNELLVKYINDLWKNTNRYPSVFHNNEQHNRMSIQEHEEILHHLMTKNSVRAELVTIHHKKRAFIEILKTTNFSDEFDYKEEFIRLKQMISRID